MGFNPLTIIGAIFSDLWIVFTKADKILFQYTKTSTLSAFALFLAGVLENIIKKKTSASATPLEQKVSQTGGAAIGRAIATPSFKAAAIKSFGPAVQGQQGFVAPKFPQYPNVPVSSTSMVKYLLTFVFLFAIYIGDYIAAGGLVAGGKMLENAVFNTLQVFIPFVLLHKAVESSVGNNIIREVLSGIILYFLYNWTRNFRDLTKRNVFVKKDSGEEEEESTEETSTTTESGDGEIKALQAKLDSADKSWKKAKGKKKKRNGIVRKIDSLKSEIIALGGTPVTKYYNK